jgi:hypothetical protein
MRRLITLITPFRCFHSSAWVSWLAELCPEELHHHTVHVLVSRRSIVLLLGFWPSCLPSFEPSQRGLLGLNLSLELADVARGVPALLLR